jgi:histone H3/H4
MEDIINYLSNPTSYQEGVRLLDTHIKNKQLVGFLGRKENDTNKQKLFYELGKLAGVDPNEIAKKAVPSKKVKMPKAPPSKKIPVERALKENTPQAPATDAYEALQKKATDLFNERAKLSNTLADLTTDEDRQKVATQIDEIEKAYDVLKAQIDAFGKAPVSKEETPVKAINPSSRRGNHGEKRRPS